MIGHREPPFLFKRTQAGGVTKLKYNVHREMIWHFYPKQIMKTLQTAIAFFVLAHSSFGQSIFGEIRGVVLDATGSAVPSAAIVATKTSTGEIRQSTTD